MENQLAVKGLETACTVTEDKIHESCVRSWRIHLTRMVDTRNKNMNKQVDRLEEKITKDLDSAIKEMNEKTVQGPNGDPSFKIQVEVASPIEKSGKRSCEDPQSKQPSHSELLRDDTAFSPFVGYKSLAEKEEYSLEHVLADPYEAAYEAAVVSLPVAVEDRVLHILRRGMAKTFDMDIQCLNSLKKLPESAAISVLDQFMLSVLSGAYKHNKGEYLTGLITKAVDSRASHFGTTAARFDTYASRYSSMYSDYPSPSRADFGRTEETSPVPLHQLPVSSTPYGNVGVDSFIVAASDRRPTRPQDLDSAIKEMNGKTVQGPNGDPSFKIQVEVASPIEKSRKRSCEDPQSKQPSHSELLRDDTAFSPFGGYKSLAQKDLDNAIKEMNGKTVQGPNGDPSFKIQVEVASPIEKSRKRSCEDPQSKQPCHSELLRDDTAFSPFGGYKSFAQKEQVLADPYEAAVVSLPVAVKNRLLHILRLGIATTFDIDIQCLTSLKNLPESAAISVLDQFMLSGADKHNKGEYLTGLITRYLVDQHRLYRPPLSFSYWIYQQAVDSLAYYFGTTAARFDTYASRYSSMYSDYPSPSRADFGRTEETSPVPLHQLPVSSTPYGNVGVDSFIVAASDRRPTRPQVRFDPYTGKPYKFDPFTGEPIVL